MAALSCVCKDWRKVMEEETWKRVCLDAAPALCKAMGFNEPDPPPGGRLTIYKLLVYCPGLQPSFYQDACKDLWRYEYYSDDEEGEITWWKLLGHVQSPACGFQTGPALVRDLLSTPFQADILHVTQRCEHLSNDISPTSFSGWCTCRGLINNFGESAIAQRTGVSSYLSAGPEKKQKVQQEAKHRCMYCKAPLFELDKKLFRTDSKPYSESDFEEEERGSYSVSGSVCACGHLILHVHYENPHETTACLERRAMKGPRDELQIDKSDLVQVLCERFAPVAEEHGPELRFRESLDVFSASEKLRCLAERLEEGMLDEAEDGCEESDAPCMRAGHKGQLESKEQGQVHPEMEAHEVERQQDISFSSILNSQSSWFGSPCSEILGKCEYYAFWDVIESDVEKVKGLFKEVPGSEGFVREYLGFRSESLSRIVHRIQRLHVLHERRKGEIEVALEQACIPKWPDYEAVDMFVKVGRVSTSLKAFMNVFLP
jgi:hypothetical protein